MIIKENFSLLKDLPNTLKLPSSVINSYKIDIGPRKIFVIINLIQDRIKHFSKESIIDLITDVKKREIIEVVNIPNYLLPVSYNSATKGIIINLMAMGSEDISKHDPKNLYAALLYGLIFHTLMSKKANISEKNYTVISNFLISIFVRLFGKDYGLLGTYSSEIPKLRFLMNCYILSSFFGISEKSSYRLATTSSGFDFRNIESELNEYDFSNIDDFINSLSRFKVMPGINKYIFSSKFLRLFGHGFLPGLEDLSRFISIIATSSLSGTNVVPTFISKYNEDEYNRLLEISKGILRKI